MPSILLTLKTCIRSRQSDRVSLGGFEKIGTAPNLIFLNIVCRLWLFPIGMCAGREVFCAKITDLHSWIDEKMWFYGRGGGRHDAKIINISRLSKIKISIKFDIVGSSRN